MALGDFAKNKLNNIKDILKRQAKKLLMTLLVKVGIPILFVLIIIVAIMGAFGILDDEEAKADDTPGYVAPGNGSALYDGSFTKEEFIKMVEKYNVPHTARSDTGLFRDECYKKYFVDLAGDYFDIATSHGLDPRFIICIGIHESDWGTSHIANTKGNFWGWGAYDSSPYESAVSFKAISAGIESVCSGLANSYVKEGGTWYQFIKDGGYEPTTIEGIGYRYASDPGWAKNVETHMSNIFGWKKTEASGGSGEGEIGGTEKQEGSLSKDGYQTTFTTGTRKYKNYKQGYVGETPWSHTTYRVFSPETIGSSGCTITSVAVIATGFGHNITPADVEKRSYEHGNNMCALLNYYTGLNVEYEDTNIRSGLIGQLKNGYPAMVHVTNHYFVILAVNKEQTKFYVSEVGGVYQGQNKNGWLNIDTVMSYKGGITFYTKMTKK